MEDNSYKGAGRLTYYEPSNISFENNRGLRDDYIPYQYDEYSMAVDLSIEVHNRFSCGFGKENGEKEVFYYSSENGTISFLGGTKVGEMEKDGVEGKLDERYLTVNYTDISMQNPEKNTSECLGIESINISYDSWFYPQVTIKFVDVRGGTVFQPSEKEYYNSGNDGLSKSIYKSFFSFPYPIFTLKVKGFYGRGVTYRLAVSKTTMDFDANTGNFNITVNFIGYMYGIFADIPMTFLAIAPYTTIGEQYWAEEKANGNFRFGSKTGVGCEMLTFPELRLKLAEVANNQEILDNNKKFDDEVGSINEQIAAIEELSVAKFPFKLSDGWVYGGEGNKTAYLVTTKMDMSTSFATELSGFVESLSAYDVTYGTSFHQKLGLNAYIEKDKKVPCVKYNKNTVSNIPKLIPETGTSMALRNMYISKYDGFEETLLRNAEGTQSIDVLIVDGTNGTSNFEEIRKEMEIEKASLNNKILERQEECAKINNALIEKVLGFKPTIKNIFDLAFAHMDTFTHVFYTYMRAIKDELNPNGNRTNRQKEHYQIKDGETDTEKAVALTNSLENGITDRGNYLPPFTAFYKKIDPTSSGNGMTLRWPGELVNSNDLIEVGFVKEVLAAANVYFEKALDVEKKIQSMGENPDLNIGDLTVNVEHFIPVTTYDMIHNNGFWNPYDFLKSKVKADSEFIEGDVIFAFVLRAFYYFATHKDSGDVSGNGFGVIEALNFFKAVGDSVSGNFLKFITGFVGERKSNVLDAFINCVSNSCGSVTSKGDLKISDTWKGIGNDTLLKKNGSLYWYNLYKEREDGLNYLPIGTFDPTSVKQAFNAPSTLIYDDRFLLTKNFAENYNKPTSEFMVGKTMNGGTFTVIEDGNYLPKLLESIKNEIEVSKGKLAEREGVAENGGNPNRSGDEYGEVYQSKSVLDEFEKAYNGNDDDAVYRKWAIVDGTGDHESRSKLREIVRADKETQSHYYIKYPGVVDDSKSSCIFAHPFYRKQTDKYVRAYLFLLSLPILGGKGARMEGTGLDKESENGVSMKSILLREGALYWYDEEGIEKIITTEIGYKKAEKGHYYDGDRSSDNFDTIFPIPTTGNNSGRKYLSWEAPKHSSVSRRIYLANYFKYWVDNSFSRYEQYLVKQEMYEDEKFENGLNTIAASDPAANKIKTDMIDLQSFLRNLFFTECTVFDYYNGSNVGYKYTNSLLGTTSEGNLSCGIQQMRTAIDAFLSQLKEIYGDIVEEVEENPNEYYSKIAEADRQDPFKNDDLRLSTYMTLKSLYDKWLCAPYRGIKTWKLHGKKLNNDTSDSNSATLEMAARPAQQSSIVQDNAAESVNYEPSDFDNFFYIDNYYHDISYDLNVDISKVSQWLTNCLPVSEIQNTEGILGYFNKTLYEYIAEIAQDCGGGNSSMLIALPQRFGLMSGATKDMFTPIPVCGDWDDDTSSFVFIYSYRPSEKLGDSSSNLDMNGWSPEGDGFDLTDEEIVGEIMGGDGYKIPAFGVTYAKQNQSYFKNITLTSETDGTTEVGLRATFDIAAKASQQPRESTLYGQDLYKVYANYAYECTVESMGNMQIFPLMYFQLNNIPLWKGAYMIKKVTHNIVAGNISTTFTGVRQNKYAIPFADASVTINRTEPVSQDNGGANGGGGAIDNGSGYGGGEFGDVPVGSSSVDINAFDGYEKNVGPNPNAKLEPGTNTSDINEDNITEEKPLICITPAHGPKTGKSLEWAWSTKMIDNYLIPKLRLKKYYDGTPYNIHRCNVNGNNTSSGGYSMRETRAIVNKYGSKRVISVVPHWNGGGSYYHVVMINKASNGSRRDSKIFAEMLREESLKMIEKGVNGEFKKMPDGFMRKKNIKPVMPLGENNTDGAPQQDCACVLTENWFADYKVNDISYSGPNFDALDSEGRYQTGRAWLESPEGCNVVADYHVAGIVNYINSLRGGGSSGGGYGGGSGNIPLGYTTPPPMNYTYADSPIKTNRGLVEYCQRQAQFNRPYWWGCFGEYANQDLYDTKKKMFGSIYDRTDPPYNRQYGAKAHDCCGLIKGYMWSRNPDDPRPLYNSNGFKDATSDAMLSRATRKGPISTIPEVPGIAVYMAGHVGVYIGNGRVIEAKGHAYGVVNTALAGRGWTHWGYIDEIKYLDRPR